MGGVAAEGEVGGGDQREAVGEVDTEGGGAQYAKSRTSITAGNFAFAADG